MFDKLFGKNEPEPEPQPELWPNQEPVVDGIIPTSEVSQDPHLFDGDEEDLEETD